MSSPTPRCPTCNGEVFVLVKGIAGIEWHEPSGWELVGMLNEHLGRGILVLCAPDPPLNDAAGALTLSAFCDKVHRRVLRLLVAAPHP